MSTMSPSFSSRIRMTSGSIRTIPRPASAAFASATRRNFSRPLAMVGTSPLTRRHRMRRRRGFATIRGYLNSWNSRPYGSHAKRRKWRAGSLDPHLDRFRRLGRLLLRDADFQDAVLQRRRRKVGLDLLREQEGPAQRLVAALLEEVLFVLLLPRAVRLRADLDSVRCDGQVDVLFRDARHLRALDELGALIDQVNERLPHPEPGFAPAGQRPPEALLDAPADIIEPAVHLVEPGERRVRHGPRQACLLGLRRCRVFAHHPSHLRISVETVNYVCAVLYKHVDFEGSDSGPGISGVPLSRRTGAYISRFTVIGIAPLLNSIHAISIGSTTPVGTSTRIGDPMLICSARAPMIRAFSNRVYRIAGPWAGRGRRCSLSDGDGRRTPELDASTSTLLRLVGKRRSLRSGRIAGDAVANRGSPRRIPGPEMFIPADYNRR